MAEIDGMTQDNRAHSVSLSLEIESNLPLYENKTIMDSSAYISNLGNDGLGSELLIYNKEGIKNSDSYETVKWNFKTGEGS